MSFVSTGDVGDWDYDQLDRNLASTLLFPALQEFRIAYRSNVSQARCEQKLRRVFDHTYARGILKVVKEPRPDVCVSPHCCLDNVELTSGSRTGILLCNVRVNVKLLESIRFFAWTCGDCHLVCGTLQYIQRRAQIR